MPHVGTGKVGGLPTWELHAAIERLATLNDDPAAGGITREVFTPTYRRAADEVAAAMGDAGLAVRTDAFGNLRGRWPGAEPDAAAVLTGSHFDTTLNAGRYDGVVGVLGAIAAVRRLRADGFAPRRPLEVVGFAGEEPRFGSGCIGSRAFMGALARADLDRMHDRDGVSARRRPARLRPRPRRRARTPPRPPSAVHAFVELHIEQGAVLEAAGVPIGVVTRIAAPHDLGLDWIGAATHAGATPMDLRRDALAGAAEAMVELERLARAAPSGTAVGTVGVLRVEPGAINVVPGRGAHGGRHPRQRSRRRAREWSRASSPPRARSPRGAGSSCAWRRSPRTRRRSAARWWWRPRRPRRRSSGVPYRRMISGAYHDAMVLGAGIPMGMIFVPSAGGISHHPDEYTAPADIDRGVAVLAGTLARLAA